MKTQTHLKLYLREAIDNWKYYDTIIFLIILLVYAGFTNPCDSCMVSHPSIPDKMISCLDRFNMDLTWDSTDFVRNLNDSQISFTGSNQSINII